MVVELIKNLLYNLNLYSLYPVIVSQTPAVVSVALPTELQTPVTQFCLEQRSHGGANRHVWAVDFMQLLPVLPGTLTHVAQFSINLGCGSYQPANRCDTFVNWVSLLDENMGTFCKNQEIGLQQRRAQYPRVFSC